MCGIHVAVLPNLTVSFDLVCILNSHFLLIVVLTDWKLEWLYLFPRNDLFIFLCFLFQYVWEEIELALNLIVFFNLHI